MTCDRVVDSGAYVIGALTPLERRSYEEHLAGCAACRREVAELDVLPGLLAQVDPDVLALIAAPFDMPGAAVGGTPPSYPGFDTSTSAAVGTSTPAGNGVRPDRASTPGPRHARPPDERSSNGLSQTGPSQTGPSQTGPGQAGPGQAGPGQAGPGSKAAAELRGRRRRRRRWQAAGAGLVAAGIVVAVLIGVSVLRPAEVRPTLAMHPVAASAPVTAEINFETVPGGTRIVMHCAYVGTGDDESASPSAKWTYLLVVIPRAGGQPDQVSSWRAGTGDEVQLSGVTRLTKPEIDRVELREADGTPLLNYTL